MNRAFSYQSAACRPAYPVLPHGLERSDVERLLTRCGDVFGLNPATIRILLVMIQHTRPADWTSPSTAPVCFAAQTVIAEACCRSTRAVRAAETQLSKAGIILRRVGAGGARGRWGHFTLGLDFSPLIERVDELARVEEERLALTKQRTILKKQVSAARRLARSAIDDLAQSCPEADDLPALRLILESWPRRYDALPVQALEAMLQRTEALYRKAVSALEMQSKTSGLSAGKDRPLQEQIEDQICSCNREPQAQTQQDPRQHQDAPAAICLEKARNQPKAPSMDALAKLTPWSLRQAATPDFQLYLDGYGRGEAPDPMTFVKAAVARCADLHISEDAWEEACYTMGDFAAALSILIIDARTQDRLRPIHSPGGTLRAFTRQARAGTLNLMGSLIRLIRLAHGGCP